MLDAADLATPPADPAHGNDRIAAARHAFSMPERVPLSDEELEQALARHPRIGERRGARRARAACRTAVAP